jgi:hypothetical protein
MQTKLEKTCWKDKCRYNPQKHFKVSTERERKLRKTFEMMEELCHVMLITGLKRPNTGKNDDDETTLQL